MARREAMSKRQIIGSIGCVVLLLGVFAPVIRAPVVGGINFINNSRTSGAIVLALAILSYLLIRLRLIPGLWITGLASFAVMIVSFIRVERRLHEMAATVNSDFAGTPLGGLGQYASKVVQVTWGWGVLIIGAALIVVAASMAEPPAEAPPSEE
jgi:hypothetical protein